MVRSSDSFEELRDAIYGSLIDCAYIPELHGDRGVTRQTDKRFFPTGTSEKVLTSSELERLFDAILSEGTNPGIPLSPAQLVEQVKARKLHLFLAILIISNCDIRDFLSFIETLASGYSLPKLPVRDGKSLKLILHSGAAVDIFLQRQYDFFAPVLHKHKEIKGDFRRLPYIKQKLIGEGSFGKIYEVEISPGHYDAGRSTINNIPRLVARKDFELNTEDKAYEKERDVLRDIIRSAKSHKNIIKSLGSFEFGTTYSLFMDLADCDLMAYMERNPDPPGTFVEKANFVNCAIGLAGAIVYLHEELESPNYEKLSCFHMDLKPQNILVVTDPESREQYWKLSDFNMSRVKMKRKYTNEQQSLRRVSTFGDNVYEVNKLFKKRYSDLPAASATDYTINRRSRGTYLSPEACVDNHPVQAESDTWSLGCVISVVFSYLHNGYSAVEEYRDRRASKGNDCFVTFSHEIPRLKDAHVNDAVKRWHNHLRMESKQTTPEEGALFEDMLFFLGRKVLLIDPQQRRQTTARDVREKLIASYTAYKNLATMKNAPTKTSNKRLSFKDKLIQTFQRRSAEEEAERNWRIQLKSSVKSCVFGPNAELFISIAGNSLLAYSLAHVLLTHDTGDFNENLVAHGQMYPNKATSWNSCVGVAGRYILAATDHHEFDCYFYQVPKPGNHNSKMELISHWEIKLPKIWRLALSPDAQYAAFVLCHGATDQNKGSLYIISVDWLHSTDSENKLYSIISSSSSSSTSSLTQLGRPIPLPCPAEDVCELAFSEVNGVYVVTKPRQNNRMTANSMHVYAWSIHEGKRLALAPSPIKHDVGPRIDSITHL